MRRRWVVLPVLLALAAGTGSYLYLGHERVATAGQAVYYELEGDGFAPAPGVLDDPIFADLPPADLSRPVSLGRYKPPESDDEAIPSLPARPSPVPQATEPAPPPPPPALPVEKLPVPSEPPPEPPIADVPAAPPSVPPVRSPQLRAEPVRTSAQAALVPAAPRPVPPVPSPDPEPTPSVEPPKTTAPTPVYAPYSFNERLKTTAQLHFLLIGTDSEELGRGRADVLLVLTLDPIGRWLTLLSVPRDTRVVLPERGAAKINAAYAYGGPRLQTEAVERFLGLPMDKYVEVSLGGFRRAIDEVGGVTVNPPFAFTLDGQQFEPGTVHLNGEQALAYSRMRKGDPRGDFGRNARQQEVVRSLMLALGGQSSGDLQALLERLQGHLRTNFSPSEVVNLRTHHSYLLERQRTEAVRGTGRTLGGAWYYVVSDAERRRLHLALR